MLTYFAHPIDQRRGYGADLIDTVRQLITDAGLSIFDPGHAYRLTQPPQISSMTTVDRINRTALDVCESLVAVLPAGMPTLGTPVEIERALTAGKPVAVFTDRQIIDSSVQAGSWADAGATIYDFTALPTSLGLNHALRTPKTAPVPITGTIGWTRTAVNALEPTRAYPDDAGFDLASINGIEIDPGGNCAVRTGIAVALPPGCWAMVTGRSSTWHKRGLLTIPAVIDCGWRGELWVSVYNPSQTTAKIEAGDRIGQLIVLPAWPGNTVRLDRLPGHERGLNGFGSSGV